MKILYLVIRIVDAGVDEILKINNLFLWGQIYKIYVYDVCIIYI